jgi:hypothetical protein
MKHAILALLLIYTLLPCSSWGQSSASTAPSAAQTSSPLQQELVNNLHQYIQASTQKDVNYFKRTLTDDFLYVPKNGGTSDRAAFLEDMSSPENGSEKEKEPRVYNIKVIPLETSAALVTYDEIAPSDQPRYRHITQVWVKQADSWKLKFLQTTINLWSIGDV